MKRKKIETFFKEMDSAGMIMERKGNTIEIIAHVCGNGLGKDKRQKEKDKSEDKEKG
jgi:hypothetical protein